MNKRGELEFAINKRTLERGVFFAIILVLAVLLYLAKTGTPAGVDEAATSALQAQLDAKQAQVDDLQSQLATIEKEEQLKVDAEKERQEALQNTTVPTPASPTTPALSGKVTYSWAVKGGVMTAAQYNKDLIDAKQTELDDKKDQLADASSAEKQQLNDDIDQLEDDIAALKGEDDKVKIEGVSVTIDNGKEDDVVVEYALCWVTVDCSKVKATGTISAPAGERTTEDLALTIPTLLGLKSNQRLQLTITKDGASVFKDDKNYS